MVATSATPTVIVRHILVSLATLTISRIGGVYLRERTTSEDTFCYYVHFFLLSF
jgi:hypothetical protein